MEKEELYMSFFREIDTNIHKEYIKMEDMPLDNDRTVLIYKKWLKYMLKRIKRAINNDIHNYQLWKIALGVDSCCNVLNSKNRQKYNLRELAIESLNSYITKEYNIDDISIQKLLSNINIINTNTNNVFNNIMKNVKIQFYKIYNKIFDIILFTVNHFLNDIIKNHYLKKFKDKKIKDINIYLSKYNQFIIILNKFKVGIIYDDNNRIYSVKSESDSKLILSDANSFSKLIDIVQITKKLIVNLVYDYKFYNNKKEPFSYFTIDSLYYATANKDFGFIFEGLIDSIICNIDGEKRMFLIETYFNKSYLKEINKKYPITLFDVLYLNDDKYSPLIEYMNEFLYKKYNRYITSAFDYELDYVLNGKYHSLQATKLYSKCYNFYLNAHRCVLAYMVHMISNINYSNRIKDSIFTEVRIDKIKWNFDIPFINNNDVISFDAELGLIYQENNVLYYIYPSITIYNDKITVRNLYIDNIDNSNVNDSIKEKIINNLDEVYDNIKNVIFDLYHNELIKECDQIDNFYKNISENEIEQIYFNGNFNEFIIEMMYYYNKFMVHTNYDDEVVNITINKFSTINKYRNLLELPDDIYIVPTEI